MIRRIVVWLFVTRVLGQQQCYFAAGGQYRGPDNLVPCNSTGASSCCLRGDVCLSGNACYDVTVGNVYQYGCTDITYSDETCPYKCGFDPDKSPWTALEYCNDVQDLENTWICHGPESCGCEWTPTYNMLVLQPRGCKDMGSDALVALYAPTKLAPYVSLPSTVGGSTGYYTPIISDGTSTWIETAVPGYTPADFTQLTTYRQAPTTSVWIDSNATPGPATYSSAQSYSGSAPALRPDGTSPASGGTSTTSTGGASPASGSTSTTSTGGASPAAGSTSTTSTGGASLTTESSSPSSGLSTGAKAGIGVGVAGGVILLAALGLCLYCLGRGSQKAQQQQQAQQMQQHPQQYPQSPQMHMPPYPSPQMHLPPYPSPQQQMHGINWAPMQQGPPVMDGYGAASPQYSEQLRSVSPGKNSFSQVPSPPVPVPPMELAAERLRRNLHEMDSAGMVPGEDEARKTERQAGAMGNAS